MNNAVFGKTMENVRKHRCKTYQNRKKKKLYGVRTKLSHYKGFHRKSISNRIEKKTEILMNKPAYLGLSILDV